jgi:hypothetical protein
MMVGPSFWGFSDDSEPLGLMTTGNHMVSFVTEFFKCFAGVMERTPVDF